MFHAEVAASISLGIPRSQFLGNPDQGWTPEDRAAVLAFFEFEAQRCDRCRQHPSAWTDDKGVELVDPPFEVVDFLCPACELLDDANEEDGKPRPGYHKAFRPVMD